MQKLAVVLILLPLWASAQLKEFEVSEMERPDVAVVQANSIWPDDALMLVYSSLEGLQFRSSMGAIDKQTFNSTAGRYEVLIKPLKQMIFVSKPGYMELKISTINPNPKDVFYEKVEQKKNELASAKTGTLQIVTDPAGCDLYINGIKTASKTPFKAELPQATFNVTLLKSKYQTVDTLVSVHAGETAILSLTIKPTTLWMNVNSTPTGATVKLDGIDYGTTPADFELDLTEPSKCGKKNLVLAMNGFEPISTPVDLRPSSTPLELSFSLQKQEGDFEINSAPEGVQVFIDGRYKGVTPLNESMPIGEYDVELKLESYFAPHQRLTLQAGETASLLFSMRDLTTNECADLDGNQYKTVQIGNQLWMAENLRSSQYANGEPLNISRKHSWMSVTNEGASCHYSNDTQYEKVFGRLYNWYAVHDIRNVCPVGWHVPSNEEWTILTDYLGGESKAGAGMKSADREHWRAPLTLASNQSGFSALPSGYRSPNGTFDNLGDMGYWWSSNDISSFSAWTRYVGNSSSELTSDIVSKQTGYSIRCIKD